MTKERAIEVAQFLSDKRHRLSSRDANILFQIYKNEVNTKAKTQPCQCAPAEWQRIISETLGVVDQTLATSTISLVVYEVPGDTQSEPINDTIDTPTEDSQVTQDTPKPKRKTKQSPIE